MIYQYFGLSDNLDLHVDLLNFLRKNSAKDRLLAEQIFKDCKLDNGKVSIDQILHPIMVGEFITMQITDRSQAIELQSAIEVGLDEYTQYIDNSPNAENNQIFFKMIYLSCFYLFIESLAFHGDIFKPLKILVFCTQKTKGISGLKVGLFLMSLEACHRLPNFYIKQNWSIKALAISTIIGTYFHEMLRHTKDLLLLSEPEIDQESEELISIISKNSDLKQIVEKDPNEFVIRSFIRLFISGDGIKNHYNLINNLIL